MRDVSRLIGTCLFAGLIALPPAAAIAQAVPEVEGVRPDALFRDCPRCPEMVVVPSGRFDMGANNLTEREKPVRRVVIARPFAIGRFEVTFAEWDACADAGGCKYRPGDRGWGRGSQPVANVSWNDALEYLRWLSEVTRQRYRLPSESQWEYAARARTATAFWWGEGLGKANANCADCGSPFDKRQPAPAGSFAANAFGLHEMLGNVYEWVEDCWVDSYRGAPSDGSAVVVKACSERVLRGGAFNSDSRYLRSAARFRYDADVRYYAHGFRVARDLP